MDSGLLRWQLFTIWGGPCMSLGGVPCAPMPPMTILSRGLVARIQKRIFLGRLYAMGFDWQPCTLLSSMGAFWISVIFIPGQLLCSIVLASSWGVFILLLSFSLSSWGVVYGGGIFPQGHGGYPRAATLVAPSLAFAGSLLHPSLPQEDHHSSSGSDITMSFFSPG
jgi:hypothetical protein